MSRNRSFLLALLVVVLACFGCGTNSVASGDPADAEAQIADLKKRVEALEKQIQSLRSAPTAQPAVDPKLEQEAQAAFQNIQGLLSSGKVPEAKEALTAFNQKYGATNIARSAARLNQELAVVGKDAPTEWQIDKWFQGESEVKLNSPATTLVVFWETWCPHCRNEVPKLQAVYDKYKPKGLQVLALTKVTKTATEQGVTDFISQNKMSYPVAKESGTLSQYFNVAGIPAAAVYKNGKIVWRGHPASLTDQMLESWL